MPFPAFLQSVPLLGDHYFRRQAESVAQGESRPPPSRVHLIPASSPSAALRCSPMTHPNPPTAGAVSARLRRITKEIATLPGQLPVSWESGVLVAMDGDRMDVLRASRTRTLCAPFASPWGAHLACGVARAPCFLPCKCPQPRRAVFSHLCRL